MYAWGMANTKRFCPICGHDCITVPAWERHMIAHWGSAREATYKPEAAPASAPVEDTPLW